MQVLRSVVTRRELLKLSWRCCCVICLKPRQGQATITTVKRMRLKTWVEC